MDSENLYDILGVDYSADEIEIRRAYFEKAKLYHPDSSKSDPRHFEQVKHAYVELLNPVRRASYDKTLGLRQEFGKSELANEFGDYSSVAKNGLSFNGRSKKGFLARFASALKALFSRKNKSSTKEGEKSDSAITQNFEYSADVNKLSLAIYSEQSFPLGDGESLSLSTPEDQQAVEECMALMRNCFHRHPIVSRAVLIEARVASLPSEKVFLIILEKQISRTWGIDSLQSIEVEDYPENLPGLLLCSAGDGPFSEAVNLYGIEFYPKIASANIN